MKINLIDFYVYRWFGANIINRIRKLLGLRIKKLYYKYEEPEIVCFMDLSVEQLLIDEVEKTRIY